METTEEIGETSIVGRSSRVKRKTTEIGSKDPQVIPAKTKRDGQSEIRPKHEETEHIKQFKVRSLYCLMDGCKRSFPDASKLDKHLVDDHGILQYRCLVIGCGQSFLTG